MQEPAQAVPKGRGARVAEECVVGAWSSEDGHKLLRRAHEGVQPHTRAWQGRLTARVRAVGL
jgi:hypothetical protein